MRRDARWFVATLPERITSGEDAGVAGRARALAVGAPAAEALRVHMEARARIEAEADMILLAAQVMDPAHAAHQLGAVERARRNHVERIELAVGALRRAMGAAVEILVAKARDDLDRPDHRLDMLAD